MRKEVGFVFQFPEAQLFEETVKKDIAFAPKNFGKSDEEAEAIAVRMAKMVDLPDEVLDKSPFELSGAWQLPEFWQWSRKFWFWTNRRQDLIPWVVWK